MSFEFWFSLKMNNQFSYVSFFPLTSSDHLVWILSPIHLYFLHFIHFISSFNFGFTLKFDPFHLISLISGWFSIVYFSHFFAMILIYLCHCWLLFRERIQHPSTNYFLWSFNVFIVLWYGWLVPRAVTPYFCQPHFCVLIFNNSFYFLFLINCYWFPRWIFNNSIYYPRYSILMDVSLYFHCFNFNIFLISHFP